MRLQCELVGHKHAVSCVKFSKDNKMIASCSADTTVRVWESGRSDGCWGPAEGEEQLQQQQQQQTAATVENADDNGENGHTNGEVRSPSMSAKIIFKGHEAGVNAVAWDPTSKYIVSASDDKTLIVWSIETRDKVLTLEGHTTYVFCCCFNPSGTIIASGSYDETIRLWSVKDGKCMRELPAHSDPVTSVDFSGNGTMLVSSSHDGMCRVWDTANGHCFKSLINENCPPVAFALFSPNSKFILVGTLDGHICLWSYISDVKVMKTFKGHRNEKYCIAADFLVYNKENQNIKAIVSGSEDGSIVIWDLKSREPLLRIPAGNANVVGATSPGHTDVVITVSSNDNCEIASSGFDNVIKVWGRQK